MGRGGIAGFDAGFIPVDACTLVVVADAEIDIDAGGGAEELACFVSICLVVDATDEEEEEEEEEEDEEEDAADVVCACTCADFSLLVARDHKSFIDANEGEDVCIVMI